MDTLRASLTEERKYAAFWAAFLMASLMLSLDKLAGAEWVTFVSLVYTTYVAGNQVDKYQQRKANVGSD